MFVCTLSMWRTLGVFHYLLRYTLSETRTYQLARFCFPCCWFYYLSPAPSSSWSPVFHPVECSYCHCESMMGFRYRCQQCHNYQLCQNCFWRGHASGTHSNQHQMKEHSSWVTNCLSLIVYFQLFTWLVCNSKSTWSSGLQVPCPIQMWCRELFMSAWLLGLHYCSSLDCKSRLQMFCEAQVLTAFKMAFTKWKSKFLLIWKITERGSS